jgi:hypothetical protein
MRALAAAVLAVLAALAGACGGTSAEEQARQSFGDYRQAEATRSEAEDELGRVFRDISRAAGERDRAGVLAAVGHGEEALATIYEALALEIAAAEALEGYEPTRVQGRQLKEALRQSRGGARLVDSQLEIASRDPFLDAAENAREIGRLSTESTRVSVPAAFARRRAVRAIALELGVEPPVDVMFDAPQTNPGG